MNSPCSYMPFGKFKGVRIAELPDDYVVWLLTLDLRDPLAAAVYIEARRRRLDASDGRTDRARRYRPDVAVVEELVSAGLRALARRHHPDVGGDHETMIRVTHAADWLVAQARSLAG